MTLTCVIGSPKWDGLPTEEHILPASLGGSLTSRHVICKGCNDWTGRTLDKRLFDEFRFILAALSIQNARDPKPAKPITFWVDGRNYRWDPASNTMTLHHEHLGPLESGGGVQRITVGLPLGHDVAKFQKTLEQRYRARNVAVEFEAADQVVEPAAAIPVEMKLDVSYRRAVAKIALLYAAHRYGSELMARPDYDPLRRFMLGEGTEQKFVGVGVEGHPPVLTRVRPPQHLITTFGYNGRLFAHVVLFGGLVHLVELGPTGDHARPHTCRLDPWEHQISGVDEFNPLDRIDLGTLEGHLQLTEKQPRKPLALAKGMNRLLPTRAVTPRWTA